MYLAGALSLAVAVGACSKASASQDGSQGGDGGASSAEGAGGASATVTASTSAGTGGAPASYSPTALAAALPRVVSNGVPVVLTSPGVLPITVDGDPNRADIEAFVVDFAQSAAWALQTQEYGVGPLAAVGPQHLATGVASDADFRTLLANNLSGATGATGGWGSPDPQTVYTLFVPSADMFTAQSDVCCSNIGGYHDTITIDGVQVPYAVVCDCSGLDDITTAASHELIEAATDPYITGYAHADDAHAVWSLTTGAGEVGDLCVNLVSSMGAGNTVDWTPPDMSYSIQRTWSNAAASQGLDPCIGAQAGVYYQTVPELSDATSVGYEGKAVTTSGLRVAVGEVRTFTLDVLSDAAAGPFNVTIDDYSSLRGGPDMLDGFVPGGPYEAGAKIQAEMKVLVGSPFGEPFIIATTPASGGPTTYFYGLVFQ